MAVNKSYVRPHTEVYQFLDKAVESTGQHLTACIIGSQYDLYRFGKEEITPTPVPSSIAGQTISVAYAYDKHDLYSYDVDKSSFQVVCQDILLDMIGSSLSLVGTVSTGDYSTVKFNDVISGTGLASALQGYSIQEGDILEFTNGDSFVTKCKVKKLVLKEGETDAYDTVVLDNSPLDLSLESVITACTLTHVLKSYTGAVDAGYASDSSVTISKQITLNTETGTKAVNIYPGVGQLYPEFRVRVIPPTDEDIITVSSVTDIQEQLGTIDVLNELAYAAWCAVRGSQGRQVYVIRLRTEDVSGYLEALRKTDADSYPYTFVPVLDGSGEHDTDIIDTLVQHCLDKSNPEVQMWRTAMIGVDVAGEFTVKFIGQGSSAVEAYFAPSYAGETPVTLCLLATEGLSFNEVDVNGMSGKVSPGDYIVYSNTRYQVKEVLADNLVKLVAGPASYTHATGITIVKASTASNHKSYLHGLADRISNRRGVVVWCDHGSYAGDVIPCSYIAAEIAGIQSATLPQQPITMTEIQSIQSCPRMYTRYTQKELDEIAAGGVLIVTQDNKYGDPYIRHQLTTDATNGSLYSEMSVTKNLDNISYAISDVIKGYCGRANVTLTALPHLKQAIITKLTEFTQDSVDDLIGPSLVRFYDLSIVQDPKFKDQIIVNVTYELPLPMNNIKVYQMVYAATIQMDSNN